MYFWKLKKRWLKKRAGEVSVGIEEFRSFIFEKVQGALEVVYTDGITEVNVDTVNPLLKTLDIDTTDEGILDLIRDSLIDNFGEINPLDLDQVVQKAQEANELTEMDDCLEVALKLIDFDEDGFITQPDIYKLMLALGEDLGEYALDDMLEAVDMDKDGKISLRDFRYFLLGRDVPSRKEIFAMAEAAKKKREAEEQAQKELEAQKQRELQGLDDTQPLETGTSPAEPTETAPAIEKEVATAETKPSEDVKSEARDTAAPPTDTKRTSDPGDGVMAVSDSEDKTISSGNKVGDEVVMDSKGNLHLDISDTGGAGSVERTPRSFPSSRKEDPIIAEKRRNIFGGVFTNEAPRTARDVTMEIKEGAEQSETGAKAGAGDDTDASTNLPQLTLDITEADETERHESLLGDDDHLQVQPHDRSMDSDFDNYSESNRGDSPAPLGLSSDILCLPPPDLSAVKAAEPSPMPSPLSSPRKSPSIVGIGGLAVKTKDEALDYADVIEILHKDMMQLDNPVPNRPHRRHSSISNVDDPMTLHTVEDVEDYNNRLVFKLPQRRKSSTTPSTLPSSVKKPEVKHAEERSSLDSDEGIDLAEEEIIERTIYIGCSAQPSASSLRISMPSSEFSHEENDKPQITIDLQDIETGEEGETSSRQDTQRCENKNRLGAGLTSDTPRSISRSEFSGYHVSLASPRSYDSSSDGAEEEEIQRHDVTGPEMSRYAHSHSSRAALFSAASNQSQCDGDADADSVLLSLNDGASEIHKPTKSILKRERLANDLPHMDHEEEVVSDSSKSAGSPLISPSMRRKAKKSKRSGLSCQTIELKELELNSPVTADQFSNRRKFGMIPRDLSKFLVLGKSPKMESPTSTGRLHREKMSNTIRWATPKRPQTAAVTSKERHVLQNRRISLMQDELMPLYDQQRTFDFPSNSSDTLNTIEVPSADRPETPLMERVRSMESRILKRSTTSYDFPALNNNKHRTGSESARSDSSKMSSKMRSFSASTNRRKLNKTLSVVDLTKDLRKDATIKSNAMMAKGHSGSKSIVPLARVVMAYRSTAKKRRQSNEIYSISRQLERRGVPYQASSASGSGSAYLAESSPRDKKKKMKGAKKSPGRKPTARYTTDDDHYKFSMPFNDDDVPTLVGDLKDPDIIPHEVVFEKVRPFTAHPTSQSSNSRRSDWPRRQDMVHSSVVTLNLRLPDETSFEKKLKNVSLLSKLPIK